jgi:hypothetical protein
MIFASAYPGLSNLANPSNWIVDARDDAQVTTRVVDGDLELHTTLGTHRFVVRPA